MGRKGEVTGPEGATRVDLAGKTVMPAIIDAHGHVGYRKGASFAVENYTRENIIDHLQRLAYHGVAAVMSMGTERELGYALRDELRASPPPDTALFLTAGQGLAMPNGGPAPPLRNAPFGVSPKRRRGRPFRSSPRRKVDHYVKIWVDDRGGTVKKLPPAVYSAAIDEAHRHNLLTDHAHVRTGGREGDPAGGRRRPGASAMASGKEVDEELVGNLQRAAERLRPADAVEHAERDLRTAARPG